ncbi:MAG: hypothetical protein JWM68_3771 [Verrucomicrobiales bacterium]|nr:hypothetical protein [Verrucomicrobiales bacterium]
MSATTKADPMLFKFTKPISKYIRQQSKREKKTMTALIEETMAFRAKFKTFPPSV